MGKKIFIGLLVFAALMLLVPPFRRVVTERSGPIPGWIGAGVDRMKQPFLRWSARSDADHLLRGLADLEARGRPLPRRTREFDAFAQERMRSSDRPGRDPWGTPYRFELKPDSITVVSAGPDSIFGGEDDVRVGAPRN